jgi:hypothetical protein
MLEALFAAAAEAVFSYILDTLEPAERLRDWLKRNPAKLAYQHALARTYAAFARQYPELTTSLFNESFLTIEAAPELAKFLTRHQHPDHTQLVRLWAKSIAPQSEAGQQSVEALSKREDLNAASAYFVELLTSELKTEFALQPLFDSRALESLPAIEAKLDTLTVTLDNNFKQALAIASNYQQTVVHNYQQTITNRNGGVDFQAQEVTIGGDVVGRDKVVSNVYNSYFGGDFATLDDLYVRPDAVFQRVRVQDFVGREWLTAKVDAFLSDEKRKSGVFLLVGEAGVGKTSFMAHLVTERRYLHLFAEQVPGDVNVSRALQSLGAQLVARYQIDPYKEKGTLPAIAAFPDFLDKLLRLAADKLSAGEKIVIVCDALDEAGTAPNGNVFGLPSMLPDGVYFILSQRPVAVKLSVKADLVKEAVDAAGADNLHDVEQYLIAVCHRLEVSNQLRAHHYTEADFVRILKERSGGVWMYLFYVVSEIAAGSRAPLDLATLPSGLAGYYTDYWGDWIEGRNGRGEGPGKWDTIYAPLLATLAAAQLPISLKLLLAWSHVQATEYEVERLLRRNWRAFVTDRDIDHTPRFALYHASLRDFVTGQVDRQGLTLEAEQLIDELSRRAYDAHVHIVEYYRQQCNGDWVKLVDDDYARTHLCLHLSASDDDETMYKLVAMNKDWAEAKYAKEESYAGYLIDLNRAWQYAKTEARWNIGRQIRCALIESSIHSLAGNILGKSVELLVETKTWSLVHALSHIRQMPNEWQRASALDTISKFLSSDLQSEALSIANTISDESLRADAIVALIPSLSDNLKTEALVMARTMSSPYGRTKALISLIPYLTDKTRVEVVQEAIDSTRTIQDESERAEALACIAVHLPADLQAQARYESMAIAYAMLAKKDQGDILARLIPNLPADMKTEVSTQALAIIRSIENEYVRTEALFSILPDLSDDSKEQALPIADTISDEVLRTIILATLASLLPDRSRNEILATMCRFESQVYCAQALIELAPYLSAELAAKAVVVANAITDDYWRAITFIALNQSSLSGEVKANLIHETLITARAMPHGQARFEILMGLLPHLPDSSKAEIIQDALIAARAISDQDACARAFINLLPRLASDKLGQAVQKALDITHAISVENDMTRLYIGTELHWPSDLKTELTRDMPSISTGYARVEALVQLIQYKPPNLQADLLNEALTIARAISNEYVRSQALNRLMPLLDIDLRDIVQHELIAAARANLDAQFRAAALIDALSCLPDYLKEDIAREALNTVHAISSGDARAVAMTNLAPHLPSDLIPDILVAIRRITDDATRLDAMINLMPYLPDDLVTEILQEALTIARALPDKGVCVDAIVNLSSYLPEDSKTEVVQEAYAVARDITDQRERVKAMACLMTYLPASVKLDLLVEAFSFAPTVGYAADRVSLYSRIIPIWRESHFNGFRASMWTDNLHFAARYPRSELLGELSTLQPLIEHLGGQSAIEEFFYALRDVTTWWP